MQQPDLQRIAHEAGFRDQPLTVAAIDGAGRFVEHCQGRWPDGVAVGATDRFYAASLTKQLTAATATVNGDSTQRPEKSWIGGATTARLKKNVTDTTA